MGGEGVLMGVLGESVGMGYEVVRSLVDVERERVGLVPVGLLVPGALRVGRAVDYAAELRLADREPEVRRARVVEVMGILGLDGLADVRVAKLGADEQVLVNVAVELLNEPGALVVEMVRGMVLDDVGKKVFGGLRKVCKDVGISVICMLETVESNVLDAYCDAVYQMSDGVMVKRKGGER